MTLVMCPSCRGKGRVHLDSTGIQNRGCKRCHGFAEEFYLLDDVWAETGIGPNSGWLCFSCTEEKLGRRLEYSDLDSQQMCNRGIISFLLPRLSSIDHYRNGVGVLRNRRRLPGWKKENEELVLVQLNEF